MQAKRTSPAVKRGDVRAAKIESIDSALDLGDGNTLLDYKARIESVRTENNSYNTAKAAVDGKLDVLEGHEAELDAMSNNMLSGVRIRYGADSSEYEMAGGTRTSERKRPVRKPKTP